MAFISISHTCATIYNVNNRYLVQINTTGMHTPINEIRSFLDHDDHSLAVRRMLDACLDTRDAVLIEEAIAWSKAYHAGGKEHLPANFHAQAEQLLSKLARASTGTDHVPQPLISAANITKSYVKGNFSLSPISLQLNTGDIVGVVGENGNGKTTLLRCLAGQLAIDGGEMQYHLLRQPDYYEIKHHVAFIPQRIPKWYGLLKDNLHFAASMAGVTGDENHRMVAFMLERLDLASYAHLTWSQISSGYRTRFEIARILLQKPRLLILDEPLANLDINAQQTILTDLRYIAKSAHNPMGIILSSQQLHEVEKIADSVLFIKNGACVYQTGAEQEATITYIMELETTADRTAVLAALGENEVTLHFNGGFYTIRSADMPVQEMIRKLVTANIPVTYLREITHSTKRFF